ncbi:MAG TPA: two-component regulator propeller domain-containing protein, partial [Ferruginibacter sp.]|nr:two-component regulator propeller domain-containing protein [Ferruginibacter sp.]
MRILFYLLSYSLLSISSTAQQNNYNIIHYTTDHGLPQNSVTGIVFDKKGYCWLGTEMGLVRFDGNAFRVFSSYNIKALRSDRIRTISLDVNGNVYARNDLWQSMAIDESDALRSSSPRLLKEGATPLWVVDGLVREKKIWSEEPNIRSQSSVIASLRNGSSYCVYQSRLYYAKNDSFHLVAAFSELDTQKQMAVDEVYIFFDKDGHLRVWKDGQLQKQNEILGPIRNNKAYREGRFTCNYFIGQTYIYADGTLYGIYLKNGELNSEELLSHLPISSVSKVYYHAAQQKYYIGSLIDGLYIVSPADFSYPNQKYEMGFYAQALTANGDIICGNYLYSRQKQPVQLAFPASQVGATLYLSPGQQLYFGNEPELFRFDLATGIKKRLLTLDTRPSSIYRDKADSNTVIVNTGFYLNKMDADTIRVSKKIPINNVVISSVQTGRDS